MDKLPFLLNDEKLSEWSYHYCLTKEDDPEVRKYINDSRWAYWYCRLINDDPEIRNNITHSYWARRYCRDNKEMKKRITMENGLINCYETLKYIQIFYKNAPQNYNLDNVITIFKGNDKNVPYNQ